MDIRVLNYELTETEPKYKMVVESEGETFVLSKTYEELRQLSIVLEKNVPCALPTFPPKKLWGEKNIVFIISRKNQLANYINSLNSIRRVKNSKFLKQFTHPKVTLS